MEIPLKHFFFTNKFLRTKDVNDQKGTHSTWKMYKENIYLINF